MAALGEVEVAPEVAQIEADPWTEFALSHPEWKPRLDKARPVIRPFKFPKGVWRCKTCGIITGNGPTCKEHGGKLSVEVKPVEKMGWAAMVQASA